MNLERYSRQVIFDEIGEEGQKKLLSSRVAVAGLGALGTVIANNLCRAGVGFLRVIDRDYVELNNLQRQTLYTESDAADQLPKAVAAFERLSKVNSEIDIVPVIADINSTNIEELISDVDLVMDGSDNFEIRFLINEACHKRGIPWVYGGALSSMGATMNILPGGPCFRCVSPTTPAPGSYPTCGTTGVLNMITGVVASLESAEAIKILTGSPRVSKKYLSIDIWKNSFDYIGIAKNPDCPVCGQGRYEFLGKLRDSYSTSLCGHDAVQIVPGGRASIDFEKLAQTLGKLGAVKFNKFMFSFDNGKTAFNIFTDGRAIIKNTHDEKAAKSVYAEYIGL
jgi:adenylyltransferase/sulfurtransferase